jgi:hypothetical protein
MELGEVIYDVFSMLILVKMKKLRGKLDKSMVFGDLEVIFEDFSVILNCLKAL